MFNILGPLINPARATNQLVGVYSKDWTSILCRVLHNLGSLHVMVVHGADGLDEVTTTDKTFVSEAKSGRFSDYELTPEQFGIKRAAPQDLLGGDLEENKRIVMEILKGAPGPKRDIVLLNSGCAIYAADKANSIEEGIQLAAKSIDSGAALKKLEELRRLSSSK